MTVTDTQWEAITARIENPRPRDCNSNNPFAPVPSRPRWRSHSDPTGDTATRKIDKENRR